MMVTAEIPPARSIALRKVWAHPSSRTGGLDVETAWGVWTDQRDALVRLKVRFVELDTEIHLLFESEDLTYMQAIIECRQLLILSPPTLARLQADGGLTPDLEESVGVEVNADPTVLAHLIPALAEAEAAAAIPAEWRDVPSAAAAGSAVYDSGDAIPFIVVPTAHDAELAQLFAWRRGVDDPLETGLEVQTAWAALNDRIGVHVTFKRPGASPVQRRWLLPDMDDASWLLLAAGGAAVLLLTVADARAQCRPWPVGLPVGGYPSEALAAAAARLTHGRNSQN